MARFVFFTDLYLLIGAVLMLLANELLQGAMPVSKFLLGMLIWPEIFRLWLGEMISTYYRRIRRG